MVTPPPILTDEWRFLDDHGQEIHRMQTVPVQKAGDLAPGVKAAVERLLSRL
jgi:hypothetical protein